MEQLGKYIEVILGGTPSTSIKEYWDGNIPWASVVDFVNDKYLYKTEKTITQNGLNNSNTKLLSKGDIIISARGTVGKMVVCTKPVTFNQSCYALRTKDNNKLDQDYLFYLLKFKILELQKVSIGGVFDTIIKSTIESLKFKSVFLSLQQRIASILSAYDELIEVNNQRIKLLEETASQLYKEWFVRMRFPGYKEAKFEKGIPEGWKVVRIDSLYKTSSGGTPSREKLEYYKDGIHNWIKTGELLDNFILNTDEKISDLGLKRSSAKMFPPYTVIFAMYGNTIGQLGITSQPAATNQACCALLPLTKEFDFEFIFLTLLQNRNEVISFGMGAAQQNVNQDEIKKFKILKPTNHLGMIFKELVNPMFYQIENLQQQNTHLRQIRDRLLPRLISGKLQLPEPELTGGTDEQDKKVTAALHQENPLIS